MTPIYLEPIISTTAGDTDLVGVRACGAPMGNGYLGIKWSRDRWRHVTQKGQGRESRLETPMCLGPYISKTAGDRLGYNRPTIGNGI